jgi:CHAT domain-containing protein
LPARSVIEKAALHAYELLVMRQSLNAGKPAEYEQRLQRIKKAEEQYWIEAVSLSRMLFSTVAEHLDKTRLVIVSDGALQYLPFTALPLLDQKTSAKQTALLIDKYEIVNLPSASTLADLRKGSAGRQPAPKLVAVVASPVFSFDDSRLTIAGGNKDQAGDLTADLLRAWRSSGGEKSIPPLPFSEKEGREIIKLAPPQSSLLAMGFDASRSLLESQRLGQYRFIHFATHGLLNSDHPELSGLILSLYSPKGERVDGFLRMHEIYNLKLQADLIVLSACQTGIGKEIKGEGLIGLTRGFMYAGASRVVASLWKVDDAATAALMQHYYRYLLQEKMSPAAALRQAQLKTMQQNLRWRSPFYWAAFVLQGEYR